MIYLTLSIQVAIRRIFSYFLGLKICFLFTKDHYFLHNKGFHS